jgi:hypothetical protein
VDSLIAVCEDVADDGHSRLLVIEVDCLLTPYVLRCIIREDIVNEVVSDDCALAIPRPTLVNGSDVGSVEGDERDDVELDEVIISAH